MKNSEGNNKIEQEETVSEEISISELEQSQLEVQKWKDSFLRANADLENYRRRTAKERENWITEARSEVVLDFLQVADNFDRALQQNDLVDGSDIKTWLTGFEMIQKSMYEIFTRYHVTLIEESLDFNPEFHEAISQIDSDKVESGQIVETVQKGFMIKEKVLRPAKVVVAK